MIPFLLVLTITPSFEGPTAPNRAGLPVDVTDHLRTRLDDGELAGIVIGVTGADGARFFGFGTSGLGGDPPDEHTLFEIGSVTKVFTALLLAELAAGSEVSVDESIAHDLPPGLVQRDDAAEPITLAHLATHTSTLPRLPSNMTAAFSNPYAEYGREDLHAFPASFSFSGSPGAHFEYSNLGAALLGELLATHVGRTYAELIAERITLPLGLHDTRIELEADQRRRLAQGFRAQEPVPSWDFQVMAGCGALRSTAADLILFVEYQLGTRESSLSKAMLMTHAPRARVSPQLSIGLGWLILETEEHTLIWHDGSTGGYHSFVGFDARRGIGVVVLGNSSASIVDVGLHVLDPSHPLEPAPVAVSLGREVLERLVGDYEVGPGAVFRVTCEDDHLMGAVPGQASIALTALSETEFLAPPIDARITFEVGTDGTVRSLTIRQGGLVLHGKRVAREK